MSRRRPISRRAVTQVAVAVTVSLMLIGFNIFLRQSAPQRDLAPPIESIAEVAPLLGQVLPCDAEVPGPDEVADPTRPLTRVTSETGYACPRLWDGHLVGYVGEVVGEVLRRDGGAWLQMNDDGYALETGPLPNHLEFRGTNSGMFIWLPDEHLSLLTHPGGPRWQGDVLAITARFTRADPEDGGQLTLRAENAFLLAPARSIPRPIHVNLVISALAAAAIAAALVHRERKIHDIR